MSIADLIRFCNKSEQPDFNIIAGSAVPEILISLITKSDQI